MFICMNTYLYIRHIQKLSVMNFLKFQNILFNQINYVVLFKTTLYLDIATIPLNACSEAVYTFFDPILEL